LVKPLKGMVGLSVIFNNINSSFGRSVWRVCPDTPHHTHHSNVR